RSCRSSPSTAASSAVATPPRGCRRCSRRLPTTTLEEMADKIRLGGMALRNGVLVHGPTAWACAVRTDEGEMRIASGRKKLIGSRVNAPLLRGPARLLESVAVIPKVKRALPEAELPFEGRGAFAAM